MIEKMRARNFRYKSKLVLIREVMKMQYGNVFYLHEPFRFSFEEVVDGRAVPHAYEVPVGFMTDFASIPRPLQSLFSQLDLHVEAAVGHDYLYREKVVDRKLADQVFLAAMQKVQVPVIKRGLMYAGVRVGAAWAYGNAHDRWVS